MKAFTKIKALVALITLVLVTSCSSNQSMQEYYIANADNPHFLSLDVPASILNLDYTELNSEQKEALSSLKKLNILAFKKTDSNEAAYVLEKEKIKTILKNGKFVDLMKLNTSYGKGEVKYLGKEDAIDEVIIYGSSDDKGFAIIRVLGNNMNPAHLVQLLQTIQNSDVKGDGFGEIGQLFKD